MQPECDERIIQEAAELARAWQDRANQLLTAEEKQYRKQMQRLLEHPRDKVTLTRIIDQSFRSQDAGRVADQINDLLRRYGIPEFFGTTDRLLMQLFLNAGRYLPGLTVPKVIEKMREESRRMIIPGERQALLSHLDKRKTEGVRVNINHLGEAVLGEREARRRLATYVADLENPAVEYISVKISTIYSQIQPLAFDHTVDVLVERLSRLYQAAAANAFVRADGTRVVKFVNLDMEEYRDLEITTTAFMHALDQEPFLDHSAGIVLQAYLPDSLGIQERLTRWAMERVERGGAPVKIRVVKGANLEMEQVESALFNWPLAPYDNKRDVDANFKRMLHYGMQPDHIRAVQLGIASHNLFELAYADCLARRRGVSEGVIFEMLEGMADHVRRAIAEMSGAVLLYAPVATAEEFINAIAYLVRRLDENTGAENFLRHGPGLTTRGAAWQGLRDQFVAACRHIPDAPLGPNRIQDRNSERFPEAMGTFHEGEFNNEPDTDWALAANQRWADAIRRRWQVAEEAETIQIPLVVAGDTLLEQRETRTIYDPNRQPQQVAVAEYRLAGTADIEQAVAVARSDPDGWRSMPPDERHRMLSKVAMALREARGDLIGAAAAETGKLFSEADVEVSEAIDFAEYYPFSARTFTRIENVTARGKGVGAVVSPWNFPIAIPCGGIVAALSAGNTVIFKPASDAVLTAWVLVQCFWRAGISRNVLQFVPCAGGEAGNHLVTHPEVDFVILTGGTETGLHMLARKPDLFLCAETGGKNSTIVTAMCDRDQAIKNVIYSAFGNTGQKCSATSLLILEREVYDSKEFQRQLVDAAASLRVGPAWDFSSRMGPLIRPPKGDLERALTTLEPGESWALPPEPVADNPHLWRPGIKYGVQPGSYTHLTEFFGPVLGVMRADDLDHAVELANMTGYGLTAGLESLDIREQTRWQEAIRAGNLYINRGTTGAITLRQPFGGTGKSALGPAIKAGGPNYVSQFMDFEEHDLPRIGTLHREHRLWRVISEWRRKRLWGGLAAAGADVTRAIRAVKSYLYHWEQEFGLEKDSFHLRGQDNRHRYRPLGRIMIRIHPDDTLFETLARIAAARITGNRVLVSIPEALDNEVTAFLDGVEGRQLLADAVTKRQSEQAVIDLLPDLARIRYAAPNRVPADLLAAAARSGFYIARAPVLMEGRIELLHYVQNQSICDTYHRYGNLGDRAELPTN
ncbi:bifunctional proline dehydrogenase/L-glutamate gamma-semialdehyde dehydrogenase [Desulfatitalea alkaliphila]|uniref:L-glutamate gamma-semialdehyde dehydrogenase n=1 Tax=Desulfatitalea alkaliphila TaxID=2929485 RepID=A0AA41R6M6_9BACT|nr:proline dehydrogenase family protein [Desulfatitalea alkaliphila]MCJ8502686.1 proline dehydrogenase family protein [Desulfatitalea alkaliphila]